MGFITNKERGKIQKGLNKSYTFKKFTIFTTIIINIALLTFLIAAIIGVMPLFKDGSSLKGFDRLTEWGIIAFVLLIFTILLDLISMIMVLTLKSPKDIKEKAINLITTPVSGQKGSVNKKIIKRINHSNKQKND